MREQTHCVYNSVPGQHRCSINPQAKGSEVSSKNVGKESLFRDTIAALNEAGLKLCVSHGYGGYPEVIGSDVDVICEDPAQVPRTLSEKKVADIVQVFRGEGGVGYVLCRLRGGEPTFLIFDVSADCRYEGYIFYGSEDILKNRRKFEFFKVPPPEIEFASYLVRKLMKGDLDETHGARLSELYSETPEVCGQQLELFFPKPTSAIIEDAARSGDWNPVRRRLKSVREEMLNYMSRQQPSARIRYWSGKMQRMVGRILNPSGLMVALLGPDGSGKSTVLSRVEQDLAPIFWSTKLYHKRPLAPAPRWSRRLLRRTGESGPTHDERVRDSVPPSTDSYVHEPRPPRGLAASLVKLAFWWASYTFVGYIGDIFPRLVRSTLVMFDRYYDDLLVYPTNYRYGGPLWLAHLVGRFVPRPHLVVLLDAPPEVIQARKQEVPYQETARQRRAYLEIVNDLSNGHVVDASKPLDEVVADVERTILEYMAGRVARRLKL